MKTEWLRKTIADFDPYFVAPIAEKHVINANENYLNVLTIPGVKEELIQALDTFRPQIYPKPMSDDIREALADYIGAKAENFIVGNGGDEMITYLLGTFLDPGDQILIHSPTFDMYELGAETLGGICHQGQGSSRIPARSEGAFGSGQAIPAEGDCHLQSEQSDGRSTPARIHRESAEGR